MCFCAYLVSLNTKTPSPTNFVAIGNISFFLWMNAIPFCICSTFSSYSLAYKYLGYFYFLSTAIAHASLTRISFPLDIYPGVEFLHHTLLYTAFSRLCYVPSVSNVLWVFTRRILDVMKCFYLHLFRWSCYFCPPSCWCDVSHLLISVYCTTFASLGQILIDHG